MSDSNTIQHVQHVESVGDYISRQAAIDALMTILDKPNHAEFLYTDEICKVLNELPSAQPEVIRCKDCRWWDKYGIYDNGYCMAAKHGYLSEHWEIRIRRKYKGDFYCADAERRTDDSISD